MRDEMYKVRGTRCEVHVWGARSEVEIRGARCEVPGPRCEVRGPRCEARGPRCEVRGARYKVQSARYTISVLGPRGTKCKVWDIYVRSAGFCTVIQLLVHYKNGLISDILHFIPLITVYLSFLSTENFEKIQYTAFRLWRRAADFPDEILADSLVFM